MLGLLSTIALALSANPVATPAGAKPVLSRQEIVVQANTADAVEKFVDSLTKTQSDRQIARWDRAICPRVLGLDAPHAAFISQRILEVARIAKLRAGGRHCGGDVVVVVTDDANGFTTALVRKHPALFRDSYDGVASPHERDKIVNSDLPVRWIMAGRTNQIGGSASRLRLSTVENTEISLLIVDTRKLDGITMGQLSDYISMVALSQPDPDARYGNSTILSIFQARDAGATAPAGLTDDDRSFLEAFYASDPQQEAESQRSNIKAAFRRFRSSER